MVGLCTSRLTQRRSRQAGKFGINTHTVKDLAHENTREGSEQDYLKATRIALQSANQRSDGNSREDAGQPGDAGKMADKREVLGSLDLGGQSPESLTIAVYLKALGNGSSRPASPSGEALKAGESVVQLGKK